MVVLLIVITIIFHVVLPLGLGALLALRPARSRLSRVAAILALASYGVFIVMAGAGWGMLGGYTRFVVLALLIGAMVPAAARIRVAPWRPRGGWSWAVLVTSVLAAIAMVASLASLVEGEPEAATIDLSSPLEPGSYLVIHGGNSETYNAHAVVKAQRYGLDLVRVGPWRFRAKGLMPANVQDYHVYGSRVLAPCAGEVLAVGTGHPDMTPPQPDPKALAGNYVLVHCPKEAATVLLAHLQPGSVQVTAGQTVESGQWLGRVGNSGNTTEPHLHIHAVKGSVADVNAVVTTADPLAVRLAGQSLRRNDMFDSAAPRHD